MGHPEPFPVKYVAIGNEDCGKKFYRGKIFNYIIIASCVILCTRATQCPFTTERKISQT
jgi:alpha-L-arabinofuranosidase